MLALMAAQPILPRLEEAKSLMLQVAIMTVIVAAIFYFLLRNHLQRRGIGLLKVMLALIVLYQTAHLLMGETLIGPVVMHSELSLSLVLFLSVVLLGHVFEERKRAEEQLKNEALHDSLTALPNRVLFMERLRYAHSRAQGRKGYLFAVLFLDLDRFKLLNDSFGHTFGDLLLIQVAQKLKVCLRGEDTIARMGGDEFAILLDDLGEPVQAERLAERLQKELAEPFELKGREIRTTASIGIALSTIGYQRPEDLLRDADTAMYRAKSSEKGKYEVFNTHMHQHAVRQLELEASLRRALDSEELLIHYQPIVALDSGITTGCEALLRWNHPKRGLVCPAEFIPIAEETGLILPIGKWVLQAACSQNKAWQLAGLPSICVSVNVSPRQLRQPRFTRNISEVLADTGLDPDCLELKLTEGMIMEDPETTSKMLSELCDLGVRIAIDDFGTGYSSLSYLRRFRLHNLKIDRSFVSALSKGDTASADIIRALITLGRSLKLEVTAEGVESEEHLTFLRSLHCNKGQGFVFSKPLGVEAFTEFLEQRGRSSLIAPHALQDVGVVTQPGHNGGLRPLASLTTQR